MRQAAPFSSGPVQHRMMCTSASLVQLLLTCALVGSVGACFVLTGRVRERLEKHHPWTWKWLGERKIRWTDGEAQDAALIWYVWSGQYQSLDDSALDRLALHAKLAAISCSAIVVALVVHGVLYPHSQLLGCLHG